MGICHNISQVIGVSHGSTSEMVLCLTVVSISCGRAVGRRAAPRGETMRFRYNPENYTIESDNPRIFAKRMQAGRVPFFEILLAIDEKKFGFRGVVSEADESLPRRSDGLRVWRIDVVCWKISRWNREERTDLEITNTYKFSDEMEQKHVLETLERALEVFDGDLWPTDPSSVKACVEYTDKAMNQIKSGSLIQ